MEKIDFINKKMSDGCPDCWQEGGAKCFWSSFCFIGILLTVILIPISIYDVSQEKYALRYDDLTKKVENKIYTEGKYLLTPETEMFYYNKVVKTLEFTDLVCLSNDGIYITMNIDVQYQLRKEELFDIFWEYGVEKSLRSLLSDIVLDSVRDVCGKYHALDFPDKRNEIQSDMQNTLTIDLNLTNSHTDIQYLQLVNYEFPSELNDAIDEKQIALQDIENANNEYDEKITQAETNYKTAEIQAETILNQAEGTATTIKTKANAEAESIAEQWNSRRNTYILLMEEMEMNVDDFVSQYLYGVILQNHKNTITEL